MDCGIPFCHEGCPLGNLIPEWNDLVYRDDWPDAVERLHATNNFPEFTGRLCPAPCEAACVLGINADPVTIERIEYEIAERAWAEGWVRPQLPRERTGKRVAVVGSGPAGPGLRPAAGPGRPRVMVFERAERPGGLLRYGIPEFKMEKAVLDRRLAQLRAEGVEFRCGVDAVGQPAAGGSARSDARAGPAAGPGHGLCPDVEVVAARSAGRRASTPSCSPAGPPCPGTWTSPAGAGRRPPGHGLPEAVQPGAGRARWPRHPSTPAGKRVVIIGGGDTGADCLGTAHRQGAASVHQLEILPRPPDERPDDNPWPTWPLILRTSSAHEEGGERLYAVTTTEFVDDGSGAVRGLARAPGGGDHGGRATPLRAGAGRLSSSCPASWCCWPWASSVPSATAWWPSSGSSSTPGGSVAADRRWATNVDGVFVCGDMTRGQSLIVWAIAEGRSAAAAVDRWLMGETALPAPLVAGQPALR